MRPRLALGLLPLALLLATATLSSADQAGGASGTPNDEAPGVSEESPPAPMERAGEGQASGSGEADASGAEAAGEGQADEGEETALEPIALQESIQSNANVSLPQDI